ncbi:MAG: hypothetical protein WC709_08515 [Thermoleophilia bacterium]
MKWRLRNWCNKRPRTADDDLDGEMQWRVRAWRRDPNERPLNRRLFERAELVGEDLSDLTLEQFYADGSRFRECHFERMVVASAVLGSNHSGAASEYLECVFDGARLTMASDGYSRFVRCSFRDVVITDWICFSLELVDCDFTGARLEECVFNGEVPRKDARRLKRTRNEFHGNDFSGAELIGNDFRTGVDLSLQKLPQGPDYFYVPDLAEAVRIGRAHMADFDDSELRENVEVELNLAEENVGGGQLQALFRPKDIPARDRGGLNALIELWSRELGWPVRQ